MPHFLWSFFSIVQLFSNLASYEWRWRIYFLYGINWNCFLSWYLSSASVHRTVMEILDPFFKLLWVFDSFITIKMKSFTWWHYLQYGNCPRWSQATTWKRCKKKHYKIVASLCQARPQPCWQVIEDYDDSWITFTRKYKNIVFSVQSIKIFYGIIWSFLGLKLMVFLKKNLGPTSCSVIYKGFDEIFLGCFVMSIKN